MPSTLALATQPLQTLLRVQREAAPLAERAEALRAGLLACPQVRQAWYLIWQPQSCTYAQEGGGTPLPPGQGDPLAASDQALFDQLQQQPQLDLEQLRALPCWLAGRLRRAAVHHGQALALELLPGQAGVLLLEVEAEAGLEWLPWVRELLAQLLTLAAGMARSAPLLGGDGSLIEYRMVVEHGHRIGNHTFNHIRGFEYSNPDYLANARKVDDIIHSDLFRPPHGHMGFRQYYTLRYHYRIIMWDLVTRDYSKRMRPEQVLNNVKRYARNGSIITFHDSLKSWNNGNLQYALPRAIEFLKEEGYEFKVFD